MSVRSARTSSRLSPASSATTVWACTQYRHPASAEVRTITISLVRQSIPEGPSAAPRNGIAVSSGSGTWASAATIGPGSPPA